MHGLQLIPEFGHTAALGIINWCPCGHELRNLKSTLSPKTRGEAVLHMLGRGPGKQASSGLGEGPGRWPAANDLSQDTEVFGLLFVLTTDQPHHLLAPK